MNLDMLDIGVRSAAIALVMLLGLALLRDARNRLAARLTALLCLFIAAHLVTVGDWFDAAPGVDFTVEIMSMLVPPTFWLVARAVFIDERPIAPVHLAFFGAYVLAALAHLASFGLAPQLVTPTAALVRAGMFVSVLAALATAWRGRAEDLVEVRRRLRTLLILSIGILAFAIPVMELAIFAGLLPEVSVTVSAAIILLAALGNGLALLGVREDRMLDPEREVRAQPEPDAAEAVLLARLDSLMREERLYRTERLAIGDLARAIDIPEYRLRRLINRRLGHRNFAAYLNAYRLADVRAALGDAAQADVPILTIALDAGFGSLAPFNRAFREAEGMTPSAYRQKALAGD